LKNDKQPVGDTSERIVVEIQKLINTKEEKP